MTGSKEGSALAPAALTRGILGTKEEVCVPQGAFLVALRDAGLPVPGGLCDSRGRPAGRRFSVYRNNVAVSLREALESGFPAVRSLIGDENFGHLARAFAARHAPGTPLLSGYGAGLPQFIAALPQLAHLPYLPDVAQLELLLHQSYHAGDAAPLDPALLQGLSEEDLLSARLGLAPALRLLRSEWAVVSIWRFALGKGGKPGSTAEDAVILRPVFDPEPVVLPVGGAGFIESLGRGETFGAALEAAGEDFDLGTCLGLLLEGGGLTDLRKD